MFCSFYFLDNILNRSFQNYTCTISSMTMVWNCARLEKVQSVWMQLAKVGLLDNTELLTSPFVLHTFSTATREFNPFTRLSNGFLPDSRAAETKIEKKVAWGNGSQRVARYAQGVFSLPLSLSNRYTAAYQFIVSKQGWRNLSGVLSCLSSLYTLYKNKQLI